MDHFHRCCRKQIPQQLVEPALRQLLPQGSKQHIGMQQQGRVAGVQPAGGRVDSIQHAVGQAARTLQRGKLRRVQGCQQQVLRDALGQHVIHRFPDGGGKLRRRFLGRAPQHQFQRRLQSAVIKADVDVCAQLLFQQRRFQGRLVVAQQRIQQDLHAQLSFPVREGSGVPRQCALHLIGLRLFGVVGDLQRRTCLLVLQRQMRAAGALGHLAQIVLVEEGQLLGHIHLAVQGDAAVVRAVMAAVHPDVFLIGQGRNGCRVAARNEAVGRIREHRPFQRILQLGVGRSQCTLHLVVNHAAHGAVCIAVPALLLKHALVHHGKRAKHRVQIDVQQVHEVRLVGACEGIDRLVREGHGVQKRRHAAFQHLQERRLDRILLRPRQYRVLQNVEHAGVVGGEGAESDAERLVHVLIFHQKDRRAADVVGQHRQRAVLLGAVLTAHKGITGIVHRFALLCVFHFCLALLYHPGG